MINESIKQTKTIFKLLDNLMSFIFTTVLTLNNQHTRNN